MDSIKSIILELQEANARIIVDGENLRIEAGKGVIDDRVKQLIKANKKGLIEYVNQIRQSSFSAIPEAASGNDFPLSSSQTRMWILSRFEEGNIAYNIPVVYVFEGGLNRDALAYSIARLIERHEILRTVFRENEQGQVRQYIQSPEEAGFELVHRDLRSEAERGARVQEELVIALVQEEIGKPFDLSVGPLMRAVLYQMADSKWVFVLNLHHIITDGWSMGILFNELLSFYAAFTRGTVYLPAPLSIQYKDYAVWQQNQLRDGAFREHRAYWLQQFGGPLPVLELRGDKARPAVKTYRGEMVSLHLDARLTNGIRTLSQEQGATLFMGLLAVVNTLLHRSTGQKDIIIGSPVAGREHPDLEGQIGFYINTLAIRTRFNGNDSFERLLDNIKKVTLEAYSHQAYPFDELVDNLHLQRDMSRSALFDVMVVLQNAEVGRANGQQQLGELQVSGFKGGGSRYSKFDLVFNFMEAGEELQVLIGYNSDIYAKNTIERLAAHVEKLLEAVITHPSMPVGRLPFLRETERQQLLNAFNNTAIAYPANQTLVSLWEAQVVSTPDNIALIFEDTEITYRALNEVANQLSRYLKKNYDIAAGDLAGIQLERSQWLIIAILSVLKAGGAYVPIDPSYPQDRINFMIADSGCKLVIDEKEIGQFQEAKGDYDTDNLQPPVRPDDLAYVIYTSGSTGKPKGVMIMHRSVVNLVSAQKATFGIDPSDNVLQFSTISFDASVEQIFLALTSGACLTMIDRDTMMDADKLEEFVSSRKITHIHTVPAILKMLRIRKYPHVRRVVSGGDTCPKELAARWSEYHPFYNKYGPTETTVTSIECLYSDNAEDQTVISIGRPLANTQIYILSGGELCPVGVAGEIYIGGAGLARGYLNNPVLTAEKFVANPFRSGERVYKTGDWGRWLPDGRIGFIGRADDQVKIRGYRIELGEIESAVKHHPDIESTVVVAKTLAEGEKELVAYLISKKIVSIAELRVFLSKILPAHMVPGYYVQLEAWPLMPNGKVDKKALPHPEGPGMEAGVEFIAPGSVTEKKLARIWSDILGIAPDKIGLRDSFFEMGGHSLKATRLASQIHKAFDVKISLNDLFVKSILEEQGQLIERARRTSFVAIPPAATAVDYPLSSSQRRLWVLSQFEEGSIAYNMPGIYTFEGSLNRKALAFAFTTLIARHEILRTVFRENEQGEVRQVILKPEALDFQPGYTDLREKGEERLEVLIQEESAKRFDLENGPLIRAAVFQTGTAKWIFVYNMHHIISDGWSMNILIDELIVRYNTYMSDTPHSGRPLRIQYKDYAVWQQKQLNNGQLKDSKAWWIKQLEGEIPVLELQGDKARPAVKTYNGSVVFGYFDPVLTQGIGWLCKERGATLFMGLLAVTNALLYRYTAQEDIIIGSPVAGREHADLDGQIGFYINTLALRTRFSGNDSFERLLEHVRQHTFSAWEHQAYPFDELVEDLHLQRDMSRSALFDVMLVLQNTAINHSRQNEGFRGLKITPYNGAESTISKFDLLFNFREAGDRLELAIEYNTDIFNKQSIQRLFSHFEQLLRVIIQQPSTPLYALDYLTEKEKQQVITGLNNTGTGYPQDETVVSLFEEQVERTPEHIALVFEDQVMTYRELNERANQLAHYLRKKHLITPDDLIGIRLPRNEWLVIALLGTLKAGGAYVPMDPDYPKDRIDFMVADSRCRVVIDEDELDRFTIQAQEYDRQIPVPVNKPSDLAYVIYTSGTTGKPKGALIEHRNIVRLLKPDDKLFDFNASDVWTLFHSYCFDFSVWEMYGALLFGGKLVIVSANTAREPAAFLDLLIRQKVTVLNQTPAAFYNLIQKEEEGESRNIALRYVIFGGEALQPDKLSNWHGRYPWVRLINMYGITETTVHVTYKEITATAIKSGISNIGKPIPTLSCYVLDKHRNLVPPGVAGELYVGGEGVARGYLNREELTSQRFLKSPFRKNEMLYRSGDLVKIRGYRIELAEIERTLRDHPDISSALVLAITNRAGEKELVAYVVGKQELHTAGVRSHLSGRLPAYMLPNYYIRLDRLPLTVNGKIDKKALPKPDEQGMENGKEYIAPANELELQITAIWQAVLGKERIGMRDGFFESGGDSIKVLRMISAVRKQLGLQMAVADIYANNTIEAILAHLARNSTAIDVRNAHTADHEKKIRTAIGELKERILSSDKLPNKDNIADIYPMSDIEKGMVYESSLNSELGVYHDQVIHQKRFPQFDFDRFRYALELLTDKHPMLRTAFNVSDYETEVQIVYKKVTIPLTYEDLSAIGKTDQELWIQNYLQQERKHPFVVTEAPLWRMRVFRLDANSFAFVFQCHHAIIDGWSDALLTTELNNLYIELGADPTHRPLPLRSDYKDFIVRHLMDKQDKGLKEFWRKELDGHFRLDLFEQDEQLDFYTYQFSNAEIASLKEEAVRLKTSPKVILFCGYLHLLRELSYEKEILAGLVTNTRPDCEDGDKVLGCFLNTIPFRITIADHTVFPDLVKMVHDKVIRLKDAERLSLTTIAQIHQENARLNNPFFDVLFNFVDFHAYDERIVEEEDAISEVAGESVHAMGHVRTNTFFDFAISATGGHYYLNLQIGRKLRSGLSAKSVGLLYQRILTSALQDPHRVMPALSLYNENNKQLLLNGNSPVADYPRDGTLVSLFEEQVTRTPDRVALAYRDKTISYRELNEQSNQLAHYLRKNFAVQPDDLIGVKLERSERLIITILGILKSGGAYLPVDPGNPPERIDYMISDSQCRLFIDENWLNDYDQLLTAEGLNDPIQVNQPNNLAYVIYTSGSTGKPKGVLVEHRSVVNLIVAQRAAFGISGEDNVLQASDISFDASVEQVFIALTSGARLTMIDKAVLLEAEKLEAFIDDYRITHVHLVPGILAMLPVKKYTYLKRVIAGGDTCPKDLAEKWSVHHQFYNEYGPTETTVTSIMHQYDPAKQQQSFVPVGRPLPNTTVYILKNDRLAPAGVIGEICIGGDCLARGYLNRPGYTEAAFVLNPFKEGERMYRTGDLGRWLADGTIEFTGRKDNQVKIRGYRIEPEEIEEVLRQYPSVVSGIVTVKNNAQGGKELVAYITGSSVFSASEIKTYLGRLLPAYMIPAHIVQLDVLPLTPTGKINRKALPDPDRSGVSEGVEYIAPRNAIEKKVTTIWQELLGREKVGISDHFFDLGGHSILAMKLQLIMRKESGIHIKIQDLYNHPTIEGLLSAVATRTHAGSRIIQLSSRVAEEKKNCYFIPPVLGNAILFKPLAAALQDSCNCYGIQYRGLERELAEEPLYGSILEAAMDMSRQVLAHHSNGEMVIIGYSMGAAIAFEMAKILEPTLNNLQLILVDRGVVPVTHPDNMSVSKEADWLMSKYKALIGVEIGDEAALRKFLVNNIELLNRYEPTGKINNKIYTFISAGNKSVTAMDAWNAFTNGGIIPQFIQGDHWEALTNINFRFFENAINTERPNK
ncbi:MAG: amino acid adenylation domain-containing protein [Niastella sp.]|uniref:amino acid adenylation domain-containing protein n=1 Tax=Niastella sp. TaxID=1869183 RepID=UPI00389A2180